MSNIIIPSMETIIVTTESMLERILEKIIKEQMQNFKPQEIDKTFTINQVAKILKRSHKKISDLVAAGILKATVDKRIYESSIREYNNR